MKAIVHIDKYIVIMCVKLKNKLPNANVLKPRGDKGSLQRSANFISVESF